MVTRFLKKPLHGFNSPALLLLAILGVFFRGIYFKEVHDQQLHDALFLDSLYYAKSAKLIHEGSFAVDQPYSLSPLYPYIPDYN